MSENKRILVVDDVPENVYSMKEWLEQENFEIIPAYNGKSGIELAKSEQPDLILCDIMMPDVNGYQVQQELSSNPSTSRIPFVFISAKSELKDIREGMKLGADDYITKPFNGKDLISTVKTRLKKREELEVDLHELRHSISYSLPHELQTPLTSILGFADILIEEYNSLQPDQVLDISTNIKESAARLDKIIQKILLSIKLDLIAKDKDQLNWMRNTSTLNGKQSAEKISLELAEKYKREDDLSLNLESAKIKISDTNFRIIINELVDNAFKYSNSGDKVEVSSTLNENEYNLYIIDNGNGISDQEISKIGDYIQFNRLLNEQQGTGLGLSIVKKLTDLHKGHFSIDSIPGKKTMIKVTLPADKIKI